MRAHLRYASYLLRHKWYVFLECCRLGIPWLGVIHDLSKFTLLTEWTPYALYWHSDRKSTDRPRWLQNAYDYAWLHHQKRNKHHWQWWVLVYDEDVPQMECLPMPDKYRREMLADWVGAGRAQGKPDTAGWYWEHRDRMHLHPDTRTWLEERL